MLFHNKNLHFKGVFASRREIWLGVVWLAVFAALIYAGARWIGMDDLQERIDRAGIFAPLILVLLKISTIVFAPLGGGPLYIIAGSFFGFTYGFFYVFLGDIFGSAIAFYISKIFGRKILKHFLSKEGMKYIDDILYHITGWKGLAYARVMLVGIPEAVSYAAGLTHIPFLQFMLITALVYVIPDAIMVALGRAVFTSSAMLIVWLGVGSIIAVAGGFYVMKRGRNRK